jgi:hypothetical protein
MTVALSSSTYSLEVKTNDETAEILQKDYTQYGMRSTSAGGAGYRSPTVWLINKRFSTTTTIEWIIQYGLWTGSYTEAKTGQRIATGNKMYKNVELGDRFDVNNAAGTGSIIKGGAVGIGANNQLHITNNTSTRFLGGVLMNSTGKESTSENDFTKTCAFTLFGNQTLKMTPIQKVLIFFASDEYRTDTVIQSSITTALLINYNDELSRQVTFDIDKGWSGYIPGQDRVINSNQVITNILLPTSSKQIEIEETEEARV